MNKITVIGLAAMCAFSLSATAFAAEVATPAETDGAVIETVVPATHHISVDTGEHGKITINGEDVDGNADPDRLSSPVITFEVEDGYVIDKVTINGIDVTDKIEDNTYIIDGIFEDSDIQVTYKADSSKTSSSAASSSSANSTSQNTSTTPNTGVIGGILLPAAFISGAVIVGRRKKK